MKQLKTENKQLKDDISMLEEKTKRAYSEKYEKDLTQQIQNVREESYYKGRRDCSDEMTTENHKLRELIESLRKELSEKSKKVIEL